MNSRRLEGVRPLLLSIPYTIRLSTSSTTAAVFEVGCASSAWRETEREKERVTYIYKSYFTSCTGCIREGKREGETNRATSP